MYRPIASWLRGNRLRQTMPDGEPWTQGYLLDRMQAEIGWAPHRPNYSKYETGKSTPERATLERFVTFWARYGEPAPDLNPPEPETTPDLASAILALANEIREARQEREAFRESYEVRLRALEAELGSLRAGPAGGGLPARSAPLGSAG